MSNFPVTASDISGSLLKSAEAWAAEGLKQSTLASEQVRQNNINVAQNHLTLSKEAAAHELALRQLLATTTVRIP